MTPCQECHLSQDSQSDRVYTMSGSESTPCIRDGVLLGRSDRQGAFSEYCLLFHSTHGPRACEMACVSQILWLLGDTAGALPRSCRHCSWCLPGPQRQDIMAGERSYRSSVEIGPGTVYHVLLSCIVTCTLSYTTPALLVFLMCQECAAISHACFCQIPQKMLLEERLAI